MTEAKTGMVWGTSLGPNPPTGASNSWEKGTYEGIADSLNDKCVERFSKTAVQHALDAVTVGLEPEAQTMRDSLKDTDYMGYDETSYPIMGRGGWAWVAASGNTIFYYLAASAPRPRSRSTSWSRQAGHRRWVRHM
ncbi:MAG: transposase [Nitrosopumilaceae archaeon]|nr:transposase [Nitrosopumilaceae archaeon]